LQPFNLPSSHRIRISVQDDGMTIAFAIVMPGLVPTLSGLASWSQYGGAFATKQISPSSWPSPDLIRGFGPAIHVFDLASIKTILRSMRPTGNRFRSRRL
jgi:hypothetical protein